MLDITQIDRAKLEQLGEAELRELAAALIDRAGRDAHAIGWHDAKIDKLTCEIAQLKRLRYGVKSEQLTGRSQSSSATAKRGAVATGGPAGEAE